MMYLNEQFKNWQNIMDPERQDPNFSSLEARSCELEVAIMLYAIVRITKPKVAMETGSYLGFSTVAIAQGMKDNGFGKLYSVDLKHEWGFHDNLRNAGVHEFVDTIDGDSLTAGLAGVKKIGKPVDYIHIDAVHTYDFVKAEIENYVPYLKFSGHMSFHDTVHPKFVDKVGKAVDEFVKNGTFERVRFFSSRGMDIVRKI